MMSNRCPLLSQIHIAQKDLGLDDATYRAALANATAVLDKRSGEIQRPGLTSSGKMNQAQRQQVIEHFKTLGWKSTAKPRHKGKQYKKRTSRLMIVIWKELYELNKVANKSNAAMEKWINNETGKQNPDWLTDEEASRVIEQLKQWKKRS